MSVTPSELGGAEHLFDAFREGYDALQARDQFAAELVAAENDFLDLIRAGAIDDLDTTSDIVEAGHGALAQTGLFLAASKIRLERTDKALKQEAAALREAYLGRQVHVVPIDPLITRPITRYFYSDAVLGGSHRYEPATTYRQRASGSISGFDRRDGTLWVTSKIGTGRVGRFLGSPNKWGVDMINRDTNEPLVTIEFID